MEQRKVFVNDAIDKGLKSKIHKQLIQLNNNKNNNNKIIKSKNRQKT